jgi:hypothetical protein
VDWYDDDDHNGACGCFVCAYIETKTAYSKTERAYSDNQNAYSETKTPKVNPKLPAVQWNANPPIVNACAHQQNGVCQQGAIC